MATKSKSGEKDDAPLIDLNEASIKKLISKAKKKGYVTYDELNAALRDSLTEIRHRITASKKNPLEVDKVPSLELEAK